VFFDYSHRGVVLLRRYSPNRPVIHPYQLRKKVDYFFIEAAFPDKEKWLADLAKHLCPSLLFGELQKLNAACEIWISHLKPREHDEIQKELQQYPGSQPLRILSAGMIFNI